MQSCGIDRGTGQDCTVLEGRAGIACPAYKAAHILKGRLGGTHRCLDRAAGKFRAGIGTADETAGINVHSTVIVLIYRYIFHVAADKTGRDLIPVVT